MERDLLLKINNTSLNFKKSAKNLGVEIDSNLRFKTHVTKCIQKSYMKLKLLYPHRHLLNQALKIKLCDSLVLSHFNYGDVLYGPCIDSIDANRVEKVQKSCLRFIFGIKKNNPISHKLKEVSWLSMSSRRKLHSLNCFHKILVTKRPSYLYDKVIFRNMVHSLNVRNNGLISIPRHKTTIFRRAFSYNIGHLYNELSDSVKVLGLHAFNTAVRKKLLQEQ